MRPTARPPPLKLCQLNKRDHQGSKGQMQLISGSFCFFWAFYDWKHRQVTGWFTVSVYYWGFLGKRFSLFFIECSGQVFRPVRGQLWVLFYSIYIIYFSCICFPYKWQSTCPRDTLLSYTHKTLIQHVGMDHWFYCLQSSWHSVKHSKETWRVVPVSMDTGWRLVGLVERSRVGRGPSSSAL